MSDIDYVCVKCSKYFKAINYERECQDCRDILVEEVLSKASCPVCKGWGRKWIKAGIPNETEKCPNCKGKGEIDGE